jgi:diaminopimelate epimerase
VPSGVRFFKYQGLGNDFVVLDARGGGSPGPDAELAKRLCDRRVGIGADGVLWLIDGPKMVVRNADGSRPEACGNGLRCVVRYLSDVGEWPEGQEASVGTDAGERLCVPLPDGLVRAAMGVAAFPEVPGLGRDVAVDVGNPHRVCFVGAIDEGLVAREGPVLGKDPAFGSGANVGFVTLDEQGDGLSLAVWERGVGPTKACGTGACAAAAAAVRRGMLPEGDVRVAQPGGTLVVHVAEAAKDGSRPVTVTGPAEAVFFGVVAL